MAPFEELNIEPFTKRARIIKCTMVFKVLNGMAPDHLMAKFKRFADVHLKNTRQAKNDLVLPRIKHNYGKRTFEYSGAKLWNSLPRETKECRCVGSFAMALQKLTFLTSAIFDAIQSCCGRLPKACEYRNEFIKMRTQVIEQSALADNLQLEAQNLQTWVETNIDRYSELKKELEDINREQDHILKAMDIDIEIILNNKTKDIMDAIKAKNNTRDELDYLQVSNMYESAIENAMNIGFPLLTLLISGGGVAYQFAKKSRAHEEVFELERRKAIRLKTPPYAQIARRKTSLIKNFKTKYGQIKDRLNTKFGRSIRFVKNIGLALSIFSAAFDIYNVINQAKKCEEIRDDAKEARDTMAKALAKFDEAIQNITTSKEIMYSVARRKSYLDLAYLGVVTWIHVRDSCQIPSVARRVVVFDDDNVSDL
ncbi:predicted protein [Nematostella vectensis]|uniref:Uncharacterized protein n=1 Tax=Nematostella vectensis TaxID=45351 RepID=A7SVU5_NEMVE|nr:predicted protein [Nematostella vectensis]|eukprot:XP_001624262.1 predicted protein [Nematostella vectensis]